MATSLFRRQLVQQILGHARDLFLLVARQARDGAQHLFAARLRDRAQQRPQALRTLRVAADNQPFERFVEEERRHLFGERDPAPYEPAVLGVVARDAGAQPRHPLGVGLGSARERDRGDQVALSRIALQEARAAAATPALAATITEMLRR
jgi:hypothetical protein